METATPNNLQRISKFFNVEEFNSLNEEMSFGEYVELLYQRPKLGRTAHQMVYDMIMSKGSEEVEQYRQTFMRYPFFENHPEYPVYGLTETLDELVKFFRGAAGGFGPERRVLLLMGPVGSAKSTICRGLKRGLEDYSRTDPGAWYTFKWVNLPEELFARDECISPMHEDPLKLMPEDVRAKVMKELNEVHSEQAPEEERAGLYDLTSEGELDPRSRFFMQELLRENDGDWLKIVEKHIRVVRATYSEADRVGIGTFQPKDEKNQDSTELTGDINWGLLPQYGADSDARAFNFDGEFNVGNRGIVEFIEVLKLDNAFLYDLLGATQESQIKPKKFSQMHVNTVIMGHTNPPEFEKLQADRTMEALRDRTVQIRAPYLLKVSEELKILEHYYGEVKQHIAPHTLYVAAMWTVLTRLHDDKDQKITLVEKAKLYDGKALPGWTQDSVKEMKDKYTDEGVIGVSFRYTQDKIANTLSSHFDYINTFMVLNEIEAGLDDSSLFAGDKEALARYHTCVELARKELEEILKNEVKKALVGDEDAIVRLCANYIDNVMAYIKEDKIRDKYTGQDREPDERLMRSIEEKIDIPEVGADDFRRMLQGFIGELAHKNETFKWDSNPRLKKALEAKQFEDVKDTIKLSALNSQGASVVDPDIQEKIDAIKTRLIKRFGYNEQSATDVLDHVSSIFARGDLAEDE